MKGIGRGHLASTVQRWLASAAATAGKGIRRLSRSSRAGRLAFSVFLAADVLAVTGPMPAASAATRPLPPGLGGANWTAIPTHAKVVALTFDAGANADGVPSILGTPPRTSCSPFSGLPGPANIAAALPDRHHSVSHPYFTTLTDAQIRARCSAPKARSCRCGRRSVAVVPVPVRGYNQHTISVVNSTGFVPVGWTVDTLGWEGTSGGITTQTVLNRVLGSLQPGEIVLMHCGSNPDDHSTLDADALPAVIQSLQARGYSFITLDALGGGTAWSSRQASRPPRRPAASSTCSGRGRRQPEAQLVRVRLERPQQMLEPRRRSRRRPHPLPVSWTCSGAVPTGTCGTSGTSRPAAGAPAADAREPSRAAAGGGPA